MRDLIDRQVAINTFHAFAPGIPWDTLDKIFAEIPSAQPEILACGEGELNVPDSNVGDMISRQAAIEAVMAWEEGSVWDKECLKHRGEPFWVAPSDVIEKLPSAQPTLYGYNIDHLVLIANVLRKENLPPERVVEALTDIGRIVAIVRDEFEETLRKAVEQCKI